MGRVTASSSTTSYFDLPLMYVIAFQKAKESVHYYFSLCLINVKFIRRHNIIDVSYLEKKVPLGDFVKKQLSTGFLMDFDS